MTPEEAINEFAKQVEGTLPGPEAGRVLLAGSPNPDWDPNATSPADGPAKSLPLPNSNRPLGVVDSEHGQIEWGPGCDYPNEASARARADEIQRELEEQWATEGAQPDWPAKVFGREWEQQLNAHCNQTFDLDIEPLFLRLDCDGEVNFGTIDSWSADEAEQMLISAFSALLSLIPAEQVVQAMGEETKDTIRMALLCEEEHEIADLRTIISECASAVGAFAAPSCSLAFMREVPKEVDSQFAKKRAQVDDLARRLHESQDAARDALRREREALARAEQAEAKARAQEERANLLREILSVVTENLGLPKTARWDAVTVAAAEAKAEVERLRAERATVGAPIGTNSSDLELTPDQSNALEQAYAVARQARLHFGGGHQDLKAIEECFELGEAVARFGRALDQRVAQDPRHTRGTVEEEAADIALVMLGMFPADSDFWVWLGKKTERLRGRLASSPADRVVWNG